MYDLKGKVALVTGAGGKRGIGRAIALRLAEAGADVVVNDVVPDRIGDPEWAGLPDVVAEIEAMGDGVMGNSALGVVANVADSASVQSMFDQAIERFGRVDILVNNAGIPAGRDRVPVIELDEEVWDQVMDVNLKGTFLCSKAAAKIMIAQGDGGKIINMSSISGKKGVARFAAYCSSKFAVRGFTQSLALELGAHQITVNAICPALIATERVADMAAALAPAGVSADEQRTAMIDNANNTTPLGRVGQAEDVAKVAAYLASSEADYMTGLSITVAGGAFMD